MTRALLVASWLLACGARQPALVPYDTTPGARVGGPDASGLNHHGVELYHASQFAAAREAFQQAFTYTRDPRYLFNMCLADTRAGELARACEACAAIHDETEQDPPDLRARLRDRAVRQLAHIERLAKQHAVDLRCDVTRAAR